MTESKASARVSSEMPGERRTLRSSKESSSSTNGEKAHPDSQSTSSNKDKLVPARTTSSKGKTFPPKKGSTNTTAKEGAGEKQQTNGTDPVENGVNGTEDVEMGVDGADPEKHAKGKDGDEGMTVVVPPPKSAKLSGEPIKDSEGDVAMETAKAEGSESEPKEVDPLAKAILGQCGLIEAKELFPGCYTWFKPY